MAALARQARLARRGRAAASPRPGAYFLDAAEDEAGPRRYLSLLERAAAAAEVPVIASLNGVSPGGWANYAHAMQDAGAAAIELNIYYLPGDPHTSGRDVEQRHVDVLTRVKDAVDLPVAVKLSPYFSSTGAMALRLDEAGADALVLFNRFLQPDIDPDKLAVRRSSRRRWIAESDRGAAGPESETSGFVRVRRHSSGGSSIEGFGLGLSGPGVTRRSVCGATRSSIARCVSRIQT